jgi:hypothetical protein
MEILSQVPTELVTCDTILGWLKEQVEQKRLIDPKIWGDAAFKLNLLQADEDSTMEGQRQDVAKLKLDILKAQVYGNHSLLPQKKNVALADAEVEATDLYRLMRLQEHKVERIKEFIKIAKKNSDIW